MGRAICEICEIIKLYVELYEISRWCSVEKGKFMLIYEFISGRKNITLSLSFYSTFNSVQGT